MISNACTLCDVTLSHQPIREGGNAFCCHGCYTVFNILSSRNQLANFQDTLVFKQALQSGLISNPTFLEQLRQSRAEIPEEEKERMHIEVMDMWCPACAEIIRLVLMQEKGVCQCVVDYTTDLASIEYSPRHISKHKIFQLINSLGYQATPLEDAKNKVSFSLYLRFVIAAFCSGNIMMFAYPIYASYFNYDEQGIGMLFAWLSLLLTLPVITYSAWPIIRRFFASLQVGLYGMETLVIIGVATATGLSIYNLLQDSSKVYFDSMTVIITFVLLGKIIETKAKFSVKESLLRLTRAIPRKGRKCFVDGGSQFVPIKEIKVGDTVAVFCGEKVVLDGTVQDGVGTCDESLMTGEAYPVAKKVGDKLLSGSIVQNGSFTYTVRASLEDSAFHRIIDLIHQEIGHKSVYIRAADKIVHWFVPLVLSIAGLVAVSCWFFGLQDPGLSIAETAFIRAISILLISCPCAIGIAAPLAESYVMNRLANLGAIVRNRGCLSLLGKETVFVFDKTGTVTEGRFSILSGLDKLTDLQKSLLKSLASKSTHPISAAICNAIPDEGLNLTGIEEFAGKGLRGFNLQVPVFLGSAAFMREQGITALMDDSEQFKSNIFTTVYFAMDQTCVAAITLGDSIRKEVLQVLQDLGPVKTILLSGDNAHAVKNVAERCHFNDWIAACSPWQKKEFIDELRQKGNIVCMIGDGINDAPALTAAHIGISVVSATDISIQVSDLLLTTDKLTVLPKIRAIAKKGQKIVNQNLFWAFFYNVIGIGLAAFGLLSPIFAAFAMVASSLIVLFNARRIK